MFLLILAILFLLAYLNVAVYNWSMCALSVEFFHLSEYIYQTDLIAATIPVHFKYYMTYTTRQYRNKNRIFIWNPRLPTFNNDHTMYTGIVTPY
jgi:hypothetical protein